MADSNATTRPVGYVVVADLPGDDRPLTCVRAELGRALEWVRDLRATYGGGAYSVRVFEIGRELDGLTKGDQMTQTLTPPLKWHGGKNYLADRIIALMPPRCRTPNAPEPDDPGWLHYVEPFAGGLAVLLANDPEGISEVVNDLNALLIGFWYVLREPKAFVEFQRLVQATAFNEFDFNDAVEWLAKHGGQTSDTVRGAFHFFVRCRQSLSGRMKGFASITRNRTRKGMNEQVSAWLNCIEGLPAVHARLKRVLILNRPALDVIRKEDGPRSLFYLDPPYLHETRATTKEYGPHEMSDADHEALLSVLGEIKGRFLLSGYRCDLYDAAAEMHGWRREDIEISNHAAGGATKRRMVECIWCNF